MDMIAPLAKTGIITEVQNLWLAIPMGLLFGAALQMAGFTDGRKIGRAFYFKDTDVPTVMFTAIITGMLGLWGLSLIGYLDISKIYFIPTYLVPVMVGGFLFGIGMVVGGYCPGTALASSVTGKLDAMVFLIGFFLGSLVFGDLYEFWVEFYKSDYRGVLRMDQLFGTSVGRTILIMVLFAIVVSVGMRLVQHLVWHNVQPISSLVLRSTQYILVGLALVVSVGMAFFPNDAFLPSEAAREHYYMVPRPILELLETQTNIKAEAE